MVGGRAGMILTIFESEFGRPRLQKQEFGVRCIVKIAFSHVGILTFAGPCCICLGVVGTSFYISGPGIISLLLCVLAMAEVARGEWTRVEIGQ